MFMQSRHHSSLFSRIVRKYWLNLQQRVILLLRGHVMRYIIHKGQFAMGLLPDTHVLRSTSGSLPRGAGKTVPRHSRPLRNPQFCVSGKRPMMWYGKNHICSASWAKTIPSYDHKTDASRQCSGFANTLNLMLRRVLNDFWKRVR